MTTYLPYLPPSIFIKNNNVLLKVGETIDLPKLGHGEHPQYGPIPPFKVLKTKPDGSLLEAEITCVGIPTKSISCNQKIHVHAGDLFQKRRCETHQKKFARLKARPGLSSEEQKARDVLQATNRADRKTKKEAEKAAKTAQREKDETERIAKKRAEIEQKKREVEARRAAAELAKKQNVVNKHI